MDQREAATQIRTKNSYHEEEQEEEAPMFQ